MARRTEGQLSLGEAVAHPSVGLNERLEKIEGLIDWAAVGARLSALRAGQRGAPPYPALPMVKALLLQQWYGLSDPELEQALSDRLSFRRFVGLALSDPTPDHTTLWRFREALKGQGLDRVVFAEIERQIDAKGLVIRRGTLIDATVVRAAAAPPKGETMTAAADPEAAFGRNATTGKTTFGYKAHLGVDLGSGIVRRCLLTPANITDTEPADRLVCGDERAVYADRAYDSKARRQRLRGLGIKPRLMHRANRHHPRLPPRLERHNRLIAAWRWPVETAFAVLKRHYRFAQCRYFNRARNEAALVLACTAMNLRRALVLT